MGLIAAAINATSGVLADQYKDYFSCEAIPETTIMVKGERRTGGKSTNKGSDNIITNGSIIAIADGQCMIIVDQGKVVEICADPGEFRWDASSEPSIFSGKLGDSIVESFKTLGKRITFGGDTAKDQRIYFFNTKELIGNKYGTPNPVPFRVVDARAGIDMDISMKCFGEYSYRVTDPILFYTNVCGNASSEYKREQIESQLKTELLTALQPAFAKISEMGIRYSSIPGHTLELADALNNELSKKWKELRGIEIVSFGVSSIKADEEDEKTLKELQKAAAYVNPNLAGAAMVNATANAMQSAASNTNGAAMAFMGMNMAQQAGGVNTQNLYAMGQQQQQAATQAQAPVQPQVETWSCSCGKTGISGNFCPECGTKRPSASGWVCSCGSINQGKFCANCGTAKPADAVQYRCDKCGWMPEDPANPPKFCPECGDPFGSEDIIK